MKQYRLNIRIDDDYRFRLIQAQTKAEMDSMKSLIPTINMENENIELIYQEKQIVIHYKLGENPCVKKLNYSEIVSCYEFRDGIIYGLTKRRFIYLPVLEDEIYNQYLWTLIVYISKNKKNKYYVIENIDCKGVSESEQKKFRRKYKKIRVNDAYPQSEACEAGKITVMILSIICIICGTLCILSTLFYKEVEYSEAVPIVGFFEKYELREVRRRRGREKEYIDIYLSSGEIFIVDDACVNNALIENIKQIEKGTKIRALKHPENKFIFELIVEEKEIMNYSEAKHKLRKDANKGLWIGLLFYMLPAAALVESKVRAFFQDKK